MGREEGGQGRRVALSPFRDFFEFGLLLFLYPKSNLSSGWWYRGSGVKRAKTPGALRGE